MAQWPYRSALTPDQGQAKRSNSTYLRFLIPRFLVYGARQSKGHHVVYHLAHVVFTDDRFVGVERRLWFGSFRRRRGCEHEHH